jgi:hypothetical protein
MTMHGRPSVVKASRDDVWMVRQLAERMAFTFERAPFGVGREPGVEDLDRHIPVHRTLTSPVDDREATGADLVEDVIPLDVDREAVGGSAGGHGGRTCDRLQDGGGTGW